jgi:hypothetical protein
MCFFYAFLEGHQALVPFYLKHYFDPKSTGTVVKFCPFSSFSLYDTNCPFLAKTACCVFANLMLLLVVSETFLSIVFRYVNAKEDRVTVIFNTLFKGDDDIVIGKIFLQVKYSAGGNARPWG